MSETGTGDGSMISLDGERKEGRFIGGRLVSGRMVRSSGLVIEGEFINETIVSGRMLYPNGHVEVIE